MKKQEIDLNIIVFIRQLSLIIDSDISLFEGLELIREKSDEKDIKTLANEMIASLSEGKSLSEAMSESAHIPAIVSDMVNIGEQSGDMTFCLNEVADNLEKSLETKSKVKQAITYPIILASLMLGVIILLVLKVLPMFNDILISLGGNMPSITAGILGFAIAIRDNIIIIVAVIIAIIVGVKMYFFGEKGQYKKDRLKLQLPVMRGINSSLIAIGFARNLSMLYRAGIPVSSSFEMIAKVSRNLYVKSELLKAKEKLDAGAEPAEVIEELGLFPWVLIKLFSVAQVTGQMDEMLNKAADFMEEENKKKIMKLTSVIEPALIIILSIIIGLILVSVMLPVINIMNTIS